MKLKITDLKIHPFAEITPNMTDEQFEALKLDIQNNGQLEPIKVSNGLIYDGRHRMRALQELGEDAIEAEVDDSLILDEIKTRVQSLENRRHQTPTQIAIMAYKEYSLLSEDKEQKVSQEVVAKRYGVSRRNLAEVKTLIERAPLVVEHLFNGQKFNIGSTINPVYTNNIRALNKYFREDTSNRSSNPKETRFTDEEMIEVNSIKDKLLSEMGTPMTVQLARAILAEQSGE